MSFDYVALEAPGEVGCAARLPWRAAAGALGLVVTGLASASLGALSLPSLPALPLSLPRSWPRLHDLRWRSSEVERRTPSPFFPNTGLDSVMLRPGAPGPAQLLPPPNSLHNRGGVSCVFCYSWADSEDEPYPTACLPSRLAELDSVEEAWVYGAKLTAGYHHAYSTGRPGDVVAGKLVCGPSLSANGTARPVPPPEQYLLNRTNRAVEEPRAEELAMATQLGARRALSSKKRGHDQHVTKKWKKGKKPKNLGTGGSRDRVENEDMPAAAAGLNCSVVEAQEDGSLLATATAAEFSMTAVMDMGDESLDALPCAPLVGPRALQVLKPRVVMAVKKDGSVFQAYAHMLPDPWPPDRRSYHALRPHEILDLVLSANMSADDYIAAWFWLGEASMMQEQHQDKAVQTHRARFVGHLNAKARSLLLEGIRPNLHDLAPWEVANIWVAARYLTIIDFPLFRHLENVTAELCEFMTAANISRTLKSWTKVNFHPSNATLGAMVVEAQRKAAHFTPHEVALTLNALSNLDYNPGQEFLQVWGAQAYSKASGFNGWEISRLLHAMAKLEHKAEPRLMTRLYKQAIRKAVLLHPKEIVIMWEAWVKLRYVPDANTLALLSHEVLTKAPLLQANEIALALNAYSKLDFNPGKSALRVMHEEARRKGVALDGQSLALTLNAWVKLGYNPGEDALRAMWEEAVCHVSGFNARETALVLHSWTRLNFSPGDAALNILAEQAIAKAQDFNGKEIALMLNSWLRFEYRPPGATLQVLSQESVKKSTTFWSQSISTTLNSLARMGFYPGDELMESMCEETVRKAKTFNCPEFTSTLNAFPRLGYQPSPALLRSVAEAMKQLKKFRLQDVAVILHSFCLLGYVDVELFQRLIDLLPPAVTCGLDQLALSQLYTVNLSLQLLFPHTNLRIPDSLAKACAEVEGANHRQATSSLFHMDVSAILKELGVPHRNEDWDSGLSLDIVLTDPKGSGLAQEKVALEVDGPWHFVTGMSEEWRCLGTTLHKRRLLGAMGWCVISIPFYEWSARRPGERAHYLQQKMQLSHCARAGAMNQHANEQQYEPPGGYNATAGWVSGRHDPL
eukprot:g23462.t1